MKKFLVGLAIGLGLLFGAKAEAQNGLYQTCNLTTNMGQAVAGAQVFFLGQPANTSNPLNLTPLVNVYTSTTGGLTTDPVLTNGNGQCVAYLAYGLYTVCYVSPQTGKSCFVDQAIISPSGGTSFTAGGDLSGSSTSQSVIGLKSVPFCSGFSPTNGQFVKYTTGGSPNPCYGAASPASGFTAGGDLSGSSSSQQVVGINSVPLCSGFTPINGEYLKYTTGGSPNPCYSAATPTGAGTVNSGLSGQDSYFPASGTAVSGVTPLSENVMKFGAVADKFPDRWYNQAFTGSDNTVSLPGATLNCASLQDGNHYIVLNNNFSAWADGLPFAASTSTVTTAWGSFYLTVPGNVSKISTTGCDDVGDTITIANSFVGSTSGYAIIGTDNVPAALACQAAVTAGGGLGDCSFPAGEFLFATNSANVLVNPGTSGTYGTTSGGTGGTVTCSLQVVQPFGIASCSVSGGSNYTKSSVIPTVITGGCGNQGLGNNCGNAVVNVNTDSSGVFSSATVVLPGYNFQSAPTVTVGPFPGTGAVASATESGGVVQSVSISSGGSGYKPSDTSMVMVAIGGAGCVGVPYWNAIPGVCVSAVGYATTNSSGVVTSGTWTSNSTTLTGNPTAIAFGNAPCYDSGTGLFDQNCVNISPILPVIIPSQVPVIPYISWFGDNMNTKLAGNWDLVTLDNATNSAMFSSPSLQFTTISGFEFDTSFAPSWNQFRISTSGVFENNTCFFTGFCIYNGATDLGSTIKDLTIYSEAPLVNGGSYNADVDNALISGGFFNIQKFDNVVIVDSVYTPTLDNWFANYVSDDWASQKSNDYYEACGLPAAVTGFGSQRQSAQPYSQYEFLGQANGPCDPGITGSALIEYGRGGSGDYGDFLSGITGKAITRYLYYGSFGNGYLANSSVSENVTPLYPDPFRFIAYPTSVSVSGTIATITAANSYMVGATGVFNGITGTNAAAINGGTYKILTASSTQFTVAYISSAGGPYSQSTGIFQETQHAGTVTFNATGQLLNASFGGNSNTTEQNWFELSNAKNIYGYGYPRGTQKNSIATGTTAQPLWMNYDFDASCTNLAVLGNGCQAKLFPSWIVGDFVSGVAGGTQESGYPNGSLRTVWNGSAWVNNLLSSYNQDQFFVPVITTTLSVNTSLILNYLTGSTSALCYLSGTVTNVGCAAGSSSPSTVWQNYGYEGTTISASANSTECYGIAIPAGGLSVGNIIVNVSTVDATHNSDIGIYNAAGTLQAHIGATEIGTLYGQAIAFTGGTQTISAGKAYVCMTSTVGTLGLSAYQNVEAFFAGIVSGATTTGGVLNSTITPPVDGPGQLNVPAIILEP